MRIKRTVSGVCATVAIAIAGCLSAPDVEAASDPLAHLSLSPPGAESLDGPCGLAVDSAARLYVSDYYRDAVDVFGSAGSAGYAYSGQLAPVDPDDGPCGLALGSSGRLYVNDFHRAVFSYGAYPSLGYQATIAGAGKDECRPTGVSVDPSTGRTYVDCRTYLAAFEASGAPIEAGGQPLRIGLGSLGDGYGLAADAAGRLYVADASTQTVKVYDPAVSTTNPVAAMQPPGGFSSLRDSSLAVDISRGRLYVADNTQPILTERPEAQIDVFSTAGPYLGVLKYRVFDALPAGLAVDNSALSSAGRVLVTSGNTTGASVYVYPPGAQTDGSLPAEAAAGTPFAASTQALRAGSVVTPHSAPAQVPGGRGEATRTQVVQRGGVRLGLTGRLEPKRLPRKGTAPIAVSVGWKLSGVEEAPPLLKEVRIEINRQGRFDFTGLPICPVAKIQPASTQRALSNCRSALVGRGSFTAEVNLSGQEPYEARGTLLLFNGKANGKPVLLGQIYAAHPFANSFVITFKLSSQKHGAYGTELSATLPNGLTSWGNLTGVQMRLSRRYRYEGASRSYISAGCPAPAGISTAGFALARASFSFANKLTLTSTLDSSCQARG